MHSKFTMAKKYIAYYLKAKKLHGIHSPFVYNFMERVLYKKNDATLFNAVELKRKELLNNKEIITIEDLGAGSKNKKGNKRSISYIANTSLKPIKWARLLYNINFYFKPNISIELGTSLGITTSYMALAMPINSKLYTIEGSEAIHNKANEIFVALQLKNLYSYLGNFDNELPKLLQTLKNNNNKIDILYIDGNHQYAPTISYFLQALTLCNNNSIIIFDDIHWSKSMEAAWQFAKQHEAVTLTIDLFFIGIVFLRKEQQQKEHFVLKY